MTILGRPISPAPGEDLTQYDPLLLEVGIRAPRYVQIDQQVSPLMRASMKIAWNQSILFGRKEKRKGARP